MDYAILFSVVIVIVIVVALLIVLRESGSPSKIIPAIISVVVVVLLVSVVVPFTDNAVNIPSTMKYDDYYDAGGASSASGSIELWEDGNGKKWIHACDVGAGSYIINGTTYEVTVDKAPLAVVLSLGQSNGAYRLKTAEPGAADPIAPLGTCYYFGDNQRPVNYGRYNENYDYDMYSMTTKYGAAKIGDFDEPFAAEYYKLSGVKTYVINACVEGTSIASWVAGEYCYEYAQTIFSLGLTAIDLEHFEPVSYVMLWDQGEGDGNTAIATYKTELYSIYEDLKDGDFNSAVQIDTMLIVKTRSIYTNSSTAQIELASETPGIYIATTIMDTFTVSNGMMNADNVHYSQLGDNVLGVAVADFYYKELII